MIKNQFNILFTSSGRRVSLIKRFKNVLNELNLEGKIITADVKKTSPAGFISDDHVLVPRVTTNEYIPNLLKICTEKNISLIIPLIDTELVTLAENKMLFEEIGVHVLVSSNEVNEICYDKRSTAKFFNKFNIDSPKEYKIDQVLKNENMEVPLLIKPAKGSSSVGVNVINSLKELEFFSKYLEEPILQELIVGEEYTIDVLVDFNGNVITAIPRLRMETRAGEVSKGMTVRNSILINKAIDLVKKLPGAVGCITVQCFLTPESEVKFIEINPRFGGGFPLSLEAGADFPRFIIESILGLESDLNMNNWTDGLVMLRYDDEIYVKKDQIS